jgi:hypothetical protein
MITKDTADALDALGRTIWNPATGLGLTSESPDIDSELASLITEPMKTIDGRDLATGFRYTLNVTNALQLRAKHWYVSSIAELQPSPGVLRVNTSFTLMTTPGTSLGYTNSYGNTLGLATCAAICYTWEEVIRRWLLGQYPLAINQP